MRKRLSCIILSLATAFAAAGADIPSVKMEAKRLPDMRIPRSGHALLHVNGELTVIGGHTTGFIPTPTAEYYEDGAWHSIPSLYTHDGGFCLPLRDGTVLLGGGLPEAFGVGQSYSVELYRPAEHAFEPLPILDRKRAESNAAELPDGTILVSGNWYAGDALEKYSIRDGGATVKETTENRGCPWILPSAPDNALIFSAVDAYGKPGQGWVDRLQGAPFQEPLLLTSHPFGVDGVQIPCKIGDYDYLLLAIGDSLEANGILRVHGEDFSLLELEADIPLSGVDGRPVLYGHHLLKHGSQVYALGTDDAGRAYLLQIGYKPALEGGKATMKLYYTDPLEDLPRTGASAMLPDGRVALTGGIDRSNYTPYASVYIFDPHPAALAAGGLRSRTAGLAAGILTALCLIGLGWWMMRRKKKPLPEERPLPEQTDPKTRRDRELFEKVSALMEEGLYTKKGLSIADLAATLGTNTKYISSSINAEAGCSFFDYVNRYRIRLAQQKMLEAPAQRLSDIADAVGFTSETAFYRNFKALTGLTPSEWLSGQSARQR